MNLENLLNRLSQQGIQVRLDHNDLLVSGAKERLTDELRNELIVNKSALVKLLQFIQCGGDPETVSHVQPDPARRHKPFPLTDIQQAYWIGATDAVSYGGVSCHYYQEFESSELDFQALEVSFNALIREQDMLRAIVQYDGRQRILKEVPFYNFPRFDLRFCDEILRANLLSAVRERMAKHVFRTDQWPLFEIHACIMDDKLIRLHLSFDLLMLDAWSLSKLIHRWKYFYNRNNGEVADVKPLSFSFRDYVLAERKYRESSHYQLDLSYWLHRLPQLATSPQLPQVNMSFKNGAELERKRFRFVIQDYAWNQIKSTAADLGCTSSGFLVTAFCEVLAAWSKEVRFSIVLTTSRRMPIHEEVGEILADFTTTTILNCETGGCFSDRLKKLQKQLQEDLVHSAVSGVEVLRRLNRWEQSLASRVMPVVFTSLLGHGKKPEVLFSSNWLGECVYGTSQTPQVTLDHQAFEHNAGLVCQWDVVMSAYPEGTIEHMFQAYETLLNSLANDIDLWLQHKLIAVPSQQQLIRKSLQPGINSEFLSGTLLPDLFVIQAQKSPHSTAVVAVDKVLSYAELNRRSLHLAQSLQSTIVNAGDPVAVIMEHGWEQVVAVLGILRAGGAYVPISAELPQSRINYICEVCNLKTALVQNRTRYKVADNISVICVEQFDGKDEGNLIISRQRNTDLAYIIFTSGSTGHPKGVMIDHRGAVNTVLDVNRRIGINSNDRVLALSSLGFDLSVYDIFGILAAGAALVMPNASQTRDPQAWLKLIKTHKVSVWNSVPALMNMFTDYIDGRTDQLGSSLRVALLSGDWIPLSLPEKIRQVAPQCKIFSLGGATEASIWSVIYPLQEVDAAWKSIPYGSAMTNQSITVLNDRLDECPDYVIGELYIGGSGLALGYWRNEEETKKRFITHPVSGKRLYKTGDIGRYLPDGNIELLGREDYQVKIQGHRIELGEIENAFNRQESVAHCVVTVRGIGPGQQFLVAYVVPNAGLENTAMEAANGNNDYLNTLEQSLLLALKEQLPLYMIPSKLVFMKDLPTTANGKIDRVRLPDPDRNTGADRPVAKMPVSNIERTLTHILGKVLGRDKIYLNERFSDLCCTSLHIVELHRELRPMFGESIPISELFNHSNVESLCRFLEKSAAGNNSEEQPPTIRYDTSRVLELRQVLMQRRRQGDV